MKQLLKKLINKQMRRKILTLLNHLWCAFCRMIPLRKTVLFYTIRADGKLAGNSQAIYDALGCKKIIFAHMLPHSKKLLPIAYYRLLTSKVIVTDDYVRYMRATELRKDQKLLQVWHACGAFKKFGLDAPSHLSPEAEKKTHAQYDAVAVTSENCRKAYASAFNVDEKICLPLGSPRTDEIVNNADSLRVSIYSKYPEFKNKKIYLYCPTFREEDGVQIDYDPMIDWDKLSDALDADEIFIVRRHPIMKYRFFEKEYQNILDLSNDSTLELTSISKAIITDYSSVIYDACLMDVPCVFYCPDYKNYERGFYLNFPADLPGKMVTNSTDIINAVRNSEGNTNLAAFKADQLSACDGHSVERITKLIYEWLEA